jgi:hypothetical protein
MPVSPAHLSIALKRDSNAVSAPARAVSLAAPAKWRGDEMRHPFRFAGGGAEHGSGRRPRRAPSQCACSVSPRFSGLKRMIATSTTATTPATSASA